MQEHHSHRMLASALQNIRSSPSSWVAVLDRLQNPWLISGCPGEVHAACRADSQPDPSVCTSPSHQLCFTRGMAFKKAGGTARQNPQPPSRNLGIRYLQNEVVFPGQIILTQRGTKYHPGKNVGLGRDHTIFATRVGLVKFDKVEVPSFYRKNKLRTVVSVAPINGDYSPAYKQVEQEMIERRAIIKRQLLRHKAHEAALYFPMSSSSPPPRSLPITLLPPPADKAVAAATKVPKSQK